MSDVERRYIFDMLVNLYDKGTLVLFIDGEFKIDIISANNNISSVISDLCDKNNILSIACEKANLSYSTLKKDFDKVTHNLECEVATSDFYRKKLNGVCSFNFAIDIKGGKINGISSDGVITEDSKIISSFLKNKYL